MLFTGGLILLALTVGMIVVARPTDGVSARFLTNWALGQAYALAALASAVIGICLILNDLPE